MTAAVAMDIKGWCPGALRPMPSGDGLLLRVRPRCGALSLSQAKGLAEAARRLGNGYIDLTRRANLQIRGLTEQGLPDLQAELDGLGLLDPDPETEAIRNIMVGPLAGLDPAGTVDVRPIAQALTQGLVAERRFATLPAKFGWLVDGGGLASIAGERADIALCAGAGKVALALDGRWLGVVAADAAVSVALAAARAFLDLRRPGRIGDLPVPELGRLHRTVGAMLQQEKFVAPVGTRPLGLVPGAAGVAAPFGRVDAEQLLRLVDLAEDVEAAEIHLSPWRALYVGGGDGSAFVDGARRLGFVVERGDPLLRIEACPGAPACRSSTVDTRRDARRIAAIGFDGTVHVSGCVKGCACSTQADLTLVGEKGQYRVVRHGTARDAAERTLSADGLAGVFHV